MITVARAIHFRLLRKISRETIPARERGHIIVPLPPPECFARRSWAGGSWHLATLQLSLQPARPVGEPSVPGRKEQDEGIKADRKRTDAKAAQLQRHHYSTFMPPQLRGLSFHHSGLRLAVPSSFNIIEQFVYFRSPFWRASNVTHIAPENSTSVPTYRAQRTSGDFHV